MLDVAGRRRWRDGRRDRAFGDDPSHEPPGRERSDQGDGRSHAGVRAVAGLGGVHVAETDAGVDLGRGLQIGGGPPGEQVELVETVVHEGSSEVSSRRASSSRARERWAFTVPSAQPSVTATSATDRSSA